MIDYPLKIDGRIAQAVAIVTFMTSYTILLTSYLDWLIYPLAVDFILRYFHPKMSPTVIVFSFLSKQLNLDEKPYFAPPKRFATFIGVLFTLSISLATLFSIVLLQTILLAGLLIASFLQGFLDFCIGCEIYDWMIKLGVVNDYHIYTT